MLILTKIMINYIYIICIDTTSFKGTTNNSEHACVYCKILSIKYIILNDKVNVNC